MPLMVPKLAVGVPFALACGCVFALTKAPDPKPADFAGTWVGHGDAWHHHAKLCLEADGRGVMPMPASGPVRCAAPFQGRRVEVHTAADLGDLEFQLSQPRFQCAWFVPVGVLLALRAALPQLRAQCPGTLDLHGLIQQNRDGRPQPLKPFLKHQLHSLAQKETRSA